MEEFWKYILLLQIKVMQDKILNKTFYEKHIFLCVFRKIKVLREQKFCISKFSQNFLKEKKKNLNPYEAVQFIFKIP